MYPQLNDLAVLHRQPEAGYYYMPHAEAATERINRTGTEVLELCDGAHSIDDICRIMSVRHVETEERVRSLVFPFLVESVTRGTVTVSPVPTPNSEVEGVSRVTGSYDSWIPLLTSFELTSSCNLTCSHCYASATLGNGIRPTTERIIETLTYMARRGTYSVLLTGGEPTMHPGFLKILHAAVSLMRLVRVATNLYSIPETIMKELIADDRITLQTSVDGVRSTHDLIRGGKNSFTRTIANIERLAQAGKIVIVAMTANRLNFREVEEVVRRCVGAGAAAFRLGLTFPIGRAAQAGLSLTEEENAILREDWQRIVETYSSPTFSLNRSEEADDFQEVALTGADIGSCGAGHLIVHVSANGDVNPCPMLSLKLGNINNQPLDEVFSGPLYRILEHASSPGSDRCAGCSLASLCGRCHAAAFAWGRTADCWWADTPLANTLAVRG